MQWTGQESYDLIYKLLHNTKINILFNYSIVLDAPIDMVFVINHTDSPCSKLVNNLCALHGTPDKPQMCQDYAVNGTCIFFRNNVPRSNIEQQDEFIHYNKKATIQDVDELKSFFEMRGAKKAFVDDFGVMLTTPTIDASTPTMVSISKKIEDSRPGWGDWLAYHDKTYNLRDTGAWYEIEIKGENTFSYQHINIDK